MSKTKVMTIPTKEIYTIHNIDGTEYEYLKEYLEDEEGSELEVVGKAISVKNSIFKFYRISGHYGFGEQQEYFHKPIEDYKNQKFSQLQSQIKRKDGGYELTNIKFIDSYFKDYIIVFRIFTNEDNVKIMEFNKSFIKEEYLSEITDKFINSDKFKYIKYIFKTENCKVLKWNSIDLIWKTDSISVDWQKEYGKLLSKGLL
ncbi:MAG: hypothetical protein Q8J85_07050 [Sulfuricurvum sp.]|nr:hypothetical protein [Sulfuricurvum sp.]MDP3023017.1 hypothetical protein [Sulfuricurvum sp.]